MLGDYQFCTVMDRTGLISKSLCLGSKVFDNGWLLAEVHLWPHWSQWITGIAQTWCKEIRWRCSVKYWSKVIKGFGSRTFGQKREFNFLREEKGALRDVQKTWRTCSSQKDVLCLALWACSSQKDVLCLVLGLMCHLLPIAPPPSSSLGALAWSGEGQRCS